MKKRTIYIFLILIVCLFEIYVLFNIFNPKVSDHYRLYYIEKKLKYWSHGKFPVYDNGELLSHTTIEPFLSSNGWSHDESNHRWTDGKWSELYVYIKNSGNFKGLINLSIGSLGKQEIHIYINDNYIGNKTINSNDTNISLSFNHKILFNNDINNIHFEFPNAHKPNNNDQRTLAIALKSFSIE